MKIAIDMIGTSLGSGTKTYNLNFCEYINNYIIKDRIFRRVIEEMVKLNPNDMILGNKLREYVQFVDKVKKKVKKREPQ